MIIIKEGIPKRCLLLYIEWPKANVLSTFTQQDIRIVKLFFFIICKKCTFAESIQK
mgnify:CR=1 FL=1|jgi:hypothetical protein